MKSIGVMTRGKAERRSIFPAGRKTYVSEIEKEKCVWGRRAEIEEVEEKQEEE